MEREPVSASPPCPHTLTASIPPVPSSTIVLLGAPGTGAPALCAALAQRLAPGAARLVWADTLDQLASDVLKAGAHGTVLLMGMDLPCPAADRVAQEAADADLRVALGRAGIGYRVVYGVGEKRVASALSAIKNIAITAYPSSGSAVFSSDSDEPTGRTARLRAWNCEKCSDPECEHRLFTALTGRDNGRQ